MTKLVLLAPLVSALFGCSDPMTEAIASRDILAYAAVNDTRDKPAFTIQADTFCRVGKTVFGKIDAYTGGMEAKRGGCWSQKILSLQS